MVKERLIKHRYSFKSALEGIGHTARAHQNFPFHLTVGILVLLAALLFRITVAEFLILIFTIFLVIFAEMVNTAIEEMINLIKEEHSVQVKIAKDVSAGMVLLAAFASVIVGLIIFGPRLLALIGYAF